MNRIIRLVVTYALAAAGVAGLVFLSACNIVSTSGGGTGHLNVLVTDAVSDDWQEVTVVLKSISLRKASDHSWVEVWKADPNNPDAGTLNLVNLAGVSDYLGKATIDEGSYDRLKIVIDTTPSKIVMVDNNGQPVDKANIVVNDPSGKGEIKVSIEPPITVPAGGTANLNVDFDLAHPLSIMVESGKVILNLQVRHRLVPRNLFDIQFARSLGYVIVVDTTSSPKTFTLKTLEGVEITYIADDNTKFTDVDTGQLGDLTKLPVDTTLEGPKGALVASNMNSDGTLYAREVWYGTLTLLPQFTPEGLVRRVGDNWIKVLNKNAEPENHDVARTRYSCHWDADIIYVNDATVWTFHDTIAMGTGTGILKFIRRGFRVTVELDTEASYKLAKSINVQSAVDEGAIRSVSDTGFVFRGWGYCQGWDDDLSPYSAQYYSHQWPYSKVPEHLFNWKYFGDPTPASESISDFVETVNQAKGANLRVFARAELYWNTDANLGPVGWAAENVVLAPEKLPGPSRITSGYSTSTKSMDVSTFDWDDETLPEVVTVYLDTDLGGLQTLVASFRWNPDTKILTFTVPVLPGDWDKLLTPSLFGVKVWVRPVKGTDGLFTWHAYTVIAFQVVSQ